MGKELVPIYECDICGKISKEPYDVRVFHYKILNGEDHTYFNKTDPERNIMIGVTCGCINKFLQLESVKPPEIKPHHIHTATPKKEVVKEVIKETVVQDKFEVPDLDEADTDPDDLHLENPEDIFDDIIDARQKNLEQPIRQDHDGKYMILYKISNKTAEEAYVASLNHTSFEHFKKNVYDKSLIGIYVQCLQSCDEIVENTTMEEISFVANIILGGTPDVVDNVRLPVSLDGEKAYIEQTELNKIKKRFNKPAKIEDMFTKR